MWGWGVGTQILERQDWTTLSKQCVNGCTHAKPSNLPLENQSLRAELVK